MGPKRCCAEGCFTKAGQGLLLKSLPTDRALRGKWLEVIPVKNGHVLQFAAFREVW